MKNPTDIQIKGIREGLLISAVTGTWDERQEEILGIVQEKNSFFDGARVCLDIGDTKLRVKEITQFRDKLSDLQVNLWAILSQSDVTANNARTLGLETVLPTKKIKQESIEKIGDTAQKAVLVTRTLRAGYRVESKESVIVIGDVNPGAEIVSGENVIVWGKLKGSAIAGAEGNLQAVICALELRPTQLRIGEIVFQPVAKKGKVFPEVALIENGEGKIEIWNKEKGQ